MKIDMESREVTVEFATLCGGDVFSFHDVLYIKQSVTSSYERPGGVRLTDGRLLPFGPSALVVPQPGATVVIRPVKSGD